MEAIRDEEQESFDNLSEGLQQSENGQKMEEAANSLDEWITSVEEIENGLGEL
jgi:hypothetical protein